MYIMSNPEFCYETCTNFLRDVYDKYPEHLHPKIVEFVKKELPYKLDGCISRIERIKDLEAGADAFINEFLINSERKFMYIGKSDIFIEYDGKQFKLVNESEILHEILTGLTEEKSLHDWKHKIKNMIVKKIKDTNMFHTIPESYTIQQVLSHMTPLLFKTKEEAKYFLSVIGDNIQKKSQSKIHLLDIKSKDFITALSDNLFSYFKNKYHIDTTFKYAWYDHPYSNCRIISFNPAVSNKNCWNTFIKYHILDILAVAVHYSNRFESSDNYIQTLTPTEQINKILFLKQNTEQDIIEQFKIQNLEIVNNADAIITQKEIHYLWKRFLVDCEIPSVIFLSKLNTVLSNTLSYDAGREVYTGVTSKHLNSSVYLRKFWTENMISSEGDEIEVDDLYDIYKSWLIWNSKNDLINESGFIAILEHFYDVGLDNGKYLQNFKCKLWDKRKEITTILDDLKITYKFSPECYEKSMDTIYTDYCSRCKSKFGFRVINKHEFERYIRKLIPTEYIKRKRILNDYWIT